MQNGRYDVLKWALDRRRCFGFMELGQLHAQDMCATELNCVISTLAPNHGAAVFWVTAEYVFLLASWGHKLMGYLHGCPCHPTAESRKAFQQQRRAAGQTEASPMSARMLVPLALGSLGMFQTDLHQRGLLKHDTLLAAETALLQFEGGQAECAAVALDFFNAKQQMHFRLRLTCSFWTELPWAIFGVMKPWAVSERVCAEETCNRNQCFSCVLPRVGHLWQQALVFRSF